MSTLGIDQLGGDMYVVELEFDDDPRRLEARAAHRDRLQALSSQGTLVLAGPWADDAGAVLVFDVPSDAALRGVMGRDPYYRAPGVTVRRIREWMPIAGSAASLVHMSPSTGEEASPRSG